MSDLNVNQIILIVVVVAAALAFDFINGFTTQPTPLRPSSRPAC